MGSSIAQPWRRLSAQRVICSAILLSSSAITSSAFAPRHTTHAASRKSDTMPRSAVIQRYRVGNDESAISQHQSSDDAFSFLPSRLASSIERLDTPSHFHQSVLMEKESLVVVRFYSEICPSCKKTRPLFLKWAREATNESTTPTTPTTAQQYALPIKIVEMPLNKANSSFLTDVLKVEQLPSCRLYHPGLGVVEEQTVLNRLEFGEFTSIVKRWRDYSPHDDREEYC